MYVQGLSTRKVKAISEELCGHEFSASTISALNKKLDGELARFAGRELEEKYPYLIVDARYKKVRENVVIQSRAGQETHAGDPDFSQRGELPEADSGAGRGNPRGWDQSAPLPGNAGLEGNIGALPRLNKKKGQ